MRARRGPLDGPAAPSYARFAAVHRRVSAAQWRDAVSLAAYFDDAATLRAFAGDKSVPGGLFQDALRLAVMQGSVRAAETLLDCGVASVREWGRATGGGLGPLRLAVLRGNCAMVEALAARTRLRDEDALSLAVVIQDVVISCTARAAEDMLLAIARMKPEKEGGAGGAAPEHWALALVCGAMHLHYRPRAIRLLMGLGDPESLQQAIDAAFFSGNVCALRVLCAAPRARAPSNGGAARHFSPQTAHIAAQLRARALLHRRNGLQRALRYVRNFRERFYAPGGAGWAGCRARFEACAVKTFAPAREKGAA
jgi:hypothetical protein